MKPSLLVLAVNQTGFEIQRFEGPKIGWMSILENPLTNREAADAYLDGMPRAPGAEYRLYAALAPKS